jgi:putative hydrolase of the HAD superfamily
MPLRVQGVIFDYGNVLCARQPAQDVDTMAALFDSSPAAFEEAYWERRDVFDAAGVTPEKYWGEIARVLGAQLTPALLGEAIELDNESWSHPSPLMARWAGAIRAAGVRTAVLSNMPVTLRRHLDEIVTWLPRFDHCTFSCDVGVAKPRPEIFEHCIAGLGVPAEETVFLDDREENTRAAAALGLHTVLFRDAAQAQRELAERFELPVPILP